MRKVIGSVVAIGLAVFLAAQFAMAGPGLGISKTAPISGTGSSGDPLKITACLSGSAYVSNGTTFDCALAGDITGVTAGNGLTGTATSGAASLAVGAGAGIAVSADAISLRTDCADGEVLVSGGTGTTWTCGAGGGGAYTAGDGLTLTANDFDITYTSDFQISTDQLDLSTAVTMPGSATVATTFSVDGNVTLGNAATDTVTVSGDLTVDDTVLFNGASITLGNQASDLVTVTGDLTVSDDTILTDVVTMNGNVTMGDAATDTVTVTGDLTVSDDTTMTAGTTTVGDIRGTVISPSSISGTVNDWSPTGYATATLIMVTPTSLSQITGLAGGGAGRIVTLCNTSGSYNLQIYDDSGASTAANRISLTGNPALGYWTLDLDSCITLVHDGTNYKTLSVNSELHPALQVETALTSKGTTQLGDAATDEVFVYGMIHDTGTAPTLSSCGSSPTVTGGSNAFKITFGTGGITACTATFASTKTNAPTCVVSMRSASEDVYLSSVSATAITITARSGTSDISSDSADVICIGDQ